MAGQCWGSIGSRVGQDWSTKSKQFLVTENNMQLLRLFDVKWTSSGQRMGLSWHKFGM